MSLHFPGKLREAQRIDSENLKMANRIIESKSIVPVKEQCARYYTQNQRKMKMISVVSNKGFQMKNLVKRQQHDF